MKTYIGPTPAPAPRDRLVIEDMEPDATVTVRLVIRVAARELIHAKGDLFSLEMPHGVRILSFDRPVVTRD